MNDVRHDAGEEEAAAATLNVAVLGASAGGVDALSRAVAALPAQPAFATVVLLHLDASQPSQLAEVLQQKTPLPVVPLAHEHALEHGRVYVLPPGQIAELKNARVQLAPRPAEGPNLPLDAFMQAAARDDAVQVAGVVLSGTGNDGAAGAAAIRAASGLVIAQDPVSAAHEGMPRALIDEGIAHQTLAPEQIGAALQRFFAPSAPAGAASDGALIAEALSLVQRQAGLDLGYYKEVNVRRRLLRRAFLQTQGDLAAYLALLRDDAQEVGVFRDDLLIGVTAFFRDPEFVQALEQHVLPELIDRHSDTIRIWVPACSTGQEAYSIAMLLHHTLQSAGITRKVQVFGTDVNEHAIRQARSGRYSAAAIAEVPEFLRTRYFVNDDIGWRIAKHVREMCVFAVHNLFSNAPFSNVDLVSARNFLIYLRKTAKRQAFEVFFYGLRRGGFLLLGPSETADPELFEENQPQLNLYRRRPVNRPPLRGYSFESPSAAASLHTEPTAPSLESLVDRLALARYAPPGFVVDANGRVVQFRGDTSPLLQPTSGDAALSLAKLVRPELQVDVRAALMEAVRSKLPVRRERVRLEHKFCSLEVVPVPAGGSERYFLVSIDDCHDGEAAAPSAEPSDARTEDLEHYVRVLGDELEQTRAQLKAVVAEYDATSEELRTANEEILSANEELQSANEELQDAKRDLEGVNATLTSLNQQLRQRNEQLVSLNDDLSNLIRGIPVPVLMLDREHCVRHFSPAAADLFELDDSRIGSALGFARRFAPEILDDALSEALQELRPVEREVRDLDGRWYMLWARAYQTSENRIEGAVLAFQDIHHLKLALETANAARAEAERANAAKNDFLALVSHELRAPLNVISNWVQLLRLLHVDKNADPRIASGLGTIERSCKEQARLIDDLLDVSRITSGNLVLDLRPVDFAAIVRAAVESMQPQADTKQIALDASGLGESIVVAGDTRRLQQIVVNILGNAIKFTPAQGHIDVALTRLDTFIELAVTDSGIGIAPDELPRVFDRFTQSDISKTRKFGGMGLGLSIVRNLTEAHGGATAAASEGLGRGARFVVRLPLAPLPLPGARDEAERATPALSLEGVQILLVDDERAGRDALAHMLGALGASVREAGSAAEALQQLEHRPFDVLIADIAMPGVDGYELMRRVRKLPQQTQREIYAIALTGFTSLGERDEAIAAGFDSHFGKPPHLHEIAARIVSGRHARDAARGGR